MSDRSTRLPNDAATKTRTTTTDPRSRISGRLSMRAFWRAVDPDHEPLEDQLSDPIKR